MKLKNLFAITAATLAATPALADINVGVIASMTGPAAALGAETRKAVSLFPATVGGEKVNFILLDDTTDPTAAVKNVRTLKTGEAARSEAGELAARAGAALMGFRPPNVAGPMRLSPSPSAGHSAGFVYLPLAFVVETVFKSELLL